jgi:hypothetical protein
VKNIIMATGFLASAACGGATVPQANSGADVALASDEDRTDATGNHFVCRGDGPNKQAALDAAQGVCNDKLCRLCGVEVESVVNTTETLNGVAVQRKVVERCKQFRKNPFENERTSAKCGDDTCSVQLQVHISKEDGERECATYSSEHFADPALCERLIEEFRDTTGRNAQSFQARMDVLDQATAACSGIDTHATPRLQRMSEQLALGMSKLLDAPDKEISRYLVYTPREDRDRTLIGRIQGIRAALREHKLVAEVFDAVDNADFDSRAGVAKLLKALEAAPAGREPSVDVRLYPIARLAPLRADLSEVIAYYRRAHPPQVAIDLARARESYGMQVSASVASRDCEATVAGTIDWSTFDEEALREHDISDFCRSALRALSKACDMPGAKDFVQRHVRTVICRNGGTGDMKLADGQLIWSVNFELRDVDAVAGRAVSALKPPSR